MENDIDSFETILGRLHLAIRKNKLKNSRQRENILKILYDQKILYDKPESKVEKHLSPEEIFALSRKNGKSASLSSIYRILAFLEKEGFVLPIETDKSGRRYE
ncbi:MAG: transcriptional repressor, partial [Helicobacter sp.]|nr:transcriptional repressor [Helicobacter sp.]